MDLAMRVARYFRTLVLSGLLTQTAVPLTACASDSAAMEITDQSPEQQVPAQMQPQMQQQLQGRPRYVDSAVQQANFYDSRPRANGMPQVEPQRRPLINSNSFSLSNLFFGRQPQQQQQSQSQPQNGRPANYMARSTPNQSSFGQPNSSYRQPQANAAQMRPRPASQQPMGPSRPTQQPVVNGRAMARPMQTNNPSFSQNFRPQSQPPIPIHTDATPRPMPLAARAMPVPMAAATAATVMPATKPAPNSSAVSPWNGQSNAAASNAIDSSTSAAANPNQTPKQAGPMSPADQLVAQAHALSNSAKTEQDYSRIIETCRRAQASQASGETVKYANNLTAWAFNRRGQLKAEAGHEKDAILDFDDAIRIDSTCWRAIHNRGVLLAQAGQFEKAFDDFSRTVQLNPQFAKAYSNRAALFMVANNLNAAQNDYKRAIDLDPNLAVAHRGCGRVCQLLGRLDDAVLHYDAAVQLAPNDAYAAACRADLLTDVGRYSDALAEYNRALELDPKSSQANCGSAWLLSTCPDSALRNPQLAVERANQAIELSGEKDAVSFDSLAAALACSGDFDGAMKSINKAIELAPADERDAYKERLVIYQQAKPYRIAPVERMAQQVSYTTK
jgi:tetratricopeptide (TPR) repeat protein